MRLIALCLSFSVIVWALASSSAGFAPFIDIPSFLLVFVTSYGVVAFNHGFLRPFNVFSDYFCKNLSLERIRENCAICKSATYSSALFGIVATLIGFVQMLQDLSDPSALGLGMSVSFLTSLYAIFATAILYFPLSTYYERLAKVTEQTTSAEEPSSKTRWQAVMAAMGLLFLAPLLGVFILFTTFPSVQSYPPAEGLEGITLNVTGTGFKKILTLDVNLDFNFHNIDVEPYTQEMRAKVIKIMRGYSLEELDQVDSFEKVQKSIRLGLREFLKNKRQTEAWRLSPSDADIRDRVSTVGKEPPTAIELPILRDVYVTSFLICEAREDVVMPY